jgi:phosphoglycolate phosphatase
MSLTDRLRRRRGVYPAHEFRLIPGTAATLETLAERYRLGLVTTRSRYHIDAFLAGFPDLAPAFAVTCGLQDTLRLKPHPAPILLAAETLGLPPPACLMVGDTTVDIRAAKRAGAWAAGVLSGFGEEGELRRSGADAIVGSVAELVEVMEKGVRRNE